MKAKFGSLVILVLVLMGCTTTPNYVPSGPVSQIELDGNLILKMDFDDAWDVYLESSPKNLFTDQFQQFRNLGLKPYFVALSKDGLFGARCLSQTSVLSFDDYMPLLRESVINQGAEPRNERAFMFKTMSAQSWDYDFGEFTFHDIILKNANKFYRFSLWSTKANFKKYREHIDQLVQSIEIVRR